MCAPESPCSCERAKRGRCSLLLEVKDEVLRLFAPGKKPAEVSRTLGVDDLRMITGGATRFAKSSRGFCLSRTGATRKEVGLAEIKTRREQELEQKFIEERGNAHGCGA